MAARKNQGKLRWKLLVSDMTEAMEEVIKVREFGAEKYEDDNNWKHKPYFSKDELLNSIMRHLAAIAKGEQLDPESGVLHSAHVAVNALFWTYYDIHDLFPPPIVVQQEVEALRRIKDYNVTPIYSVKRDTKQC
jgi:hypothetical protein